MINVKIHAPNNGVRNLSIYEYLALYAAQAEHEVTKLQTQINELITDNTILQAEIDSLKSQIASMKDNKEE